MDEVSNDFTLETITEPSQRELGQHRPAVLVVRAGHRGMTPATLNALHEMGLPVLALACSEDMNSPALFLWADFAVFPWDPVEVRARLKRLTVNAHQDSTLHWGKLTLNEDRHEAWAGGMALDLTFTEFRLLTLLLTFAGRVVSRERAYKDIWDSDHYGGLRTVDVHIRRLRSKLEARGCDYIGTVRNVGYRLRESSKPPVE